MPNEIMSVWHSKLQISMKERCNVQENNTGYLKNHWTKHWLVCTHFDAFLMLNLKMNINIKNSTIFGSSTKKLNFHLHLHRNKTQEKC